MREALGFVIAIVMISIGLTLFIPHFKDIFISMGYEAYLWTIGLIFVVIGAKILTLIKNRRMIV
jgi:hypothetical protein